MDNKVRKRTRSQTAAHDREEDAKRRKKEEDDAQSKLNRLATLGDIESETTKTDCKSYRYGRQLLVLGNRVAREKTGLLKYSQDVAATIPEIKSRFGVCCHLRLAHMLEHHLSARMPDLEHSVGLSQFLALKICAGDYDPHTAVYSPGALIDESWHKLIIKTKVYDDMFSTLSTFYKVEGTKVHHDDATADDQVAVHKRYTRTRLAALEVFGSGIDSNAWEVVSSSEWEEIIIAPMGGSSFTVHAPLGCSVETLDGCIRARRFMPGPFKYFFAGDGDNCGQRLSPHRTLESYGIKQGSQITLMTHMRGC